MQDDRDRRCMDLMDELGTAWSYAENPPLDICMDDVIDLARQRYVWGKAHYGDKTWAKSLTALRQDVLEELADALVYTAMIYRKLEDQLKCQPATTTTGE